MVAAWSVFSSQSVPRSELESLMRQFGAQPTAFPTGNSEPGSWSVPIAGDEREDGLTALLRCGRKGWLDGDGAWLRLRVRVR